MENDNELKSHHLTPYGKSFQDYSFAAPNTVHLVAQAYLDDFFSSTLSCLKDHHYHRRFFCGEFSHPGTTKMKQEYSFAYSHYFLKYSCHFSTTFLNFRV
jgi:hypothetical protein